MNETATTIITQAWYLNVWSALVQAWTVASPYVGVAILAALLVIVVRATYIALKETPDKSSKESRLRVFWNAMRNPIRPASEGRLAAESS